MDRESVITPWGFSQTATKFGEDCTFYTTSSHGGFHVRGEAMRRVYEILPASFRPFATKWNTSLKSHENWFEEDCDAHLVVAALPERFTMDEVERARKAIKANARYYGDVKLPEGATV